MATEITLLEEKTTLRAFTDDASIKLVISETKKVVDEFDHDMSTAASRKRTASLSAKISKLKVRIDDIGKDLVADWKKQAKAVDGSRKILKDALEDLRDDARKPLKDWEDEQSRIKAETEAKAEAEKAAALLEADHDIALLLNEKRDDDIAAQIILEANAAEERKRIERERMEREAKEKAERQLIEQREQFEREQAAAKAREEQRAAELEQARQEAKEAEARIVLADSFAKKQADTAAINARNAEILRQQDQEKADLAELERRESSKRHVGKIRKEAKEGLMRECGVDEDLAVRIVLAINKKLVSNIQINY